MSQFVSQSGCVLSEDPPLSLSHPLDPVPLSPPQLCVSHTEKSRHTHTGTADELHTAVAWLLWKSFAFDEMISPSALCIVSALSSFLSFVHTLLFFYTLTFPCLASTDFVYLPLHPFSFLLFSVFGLTAMSIFREIQCTVWTDAAGPSLWECWARLQRSAFSLSQRVSHCTEATQPKKAGRLVESSREREARREEEEGEEER